MAFSAVGAEAEQDMVRLLRVLKVLEVARHTLGRPRQEHLGVMAIGTGEACVSACQREESGVFEVGGIPSLGRVTGLAIAHPALGEMIRRGRAGQVGSVTRDAGGVVAREVARLGTGMTFEAGGRGVRAQQRESRSIVHRGHTSRIPGTFLVTRFTRGPEPGSVRIFMTASATARREGAYCSAVVMTTQA